MWRSGAEEWRHGGLISSQERRGGARHSNVRRERGARRRGTSVEEDGTFAENPLHFFDFLYFYFFFKTSSFWDLIEPLKLFQKL